MKIIHLITFLTFVPIIVKSHSAIEVKCGQNVDYSEDYGDYQELSASCNILNFSIPHNYTTKVNEAVPTWASLSNIQEEIFIINAHEQNFTQIFIKDASFILFPQEILKQLPNLEEIYVESSHMKFIQNFTFYPDSSISLENYDKSMWYEKTKNSSLRSLKDLNFRNNEIRHIAQYAFFGLWELTQLILAHNQIEIIHPGLFDSLIKLQQLDLLHNQIKTLDKNIFFGNRQLMSVNLGYNAIEHALELQLPESIKVLNIDHNKISSLSLSTSGKSHINKLLVTDNKIVDLQLKNININILELTNNRMESLDALRELSHLSTLYIGWNRLTSLAGMEILTNLLDLYLDGMKVEITSKTFASLPNLELLSVSETNLTKVDIDWFKGNPNLGYLGLDKNQLTELNYVELLKQPRLRLNLAINGNNFNCSYVSEMVEYLKNSPIRITERDYSNDISHIDGVSCVKDDPKENSMNSAIENDNSVFHRIIFIALGIFITLGLVFGVAKYTNVFKTLKMMNQRF